MAVATRPSPSTAGHVPVGTARGEMEPPLWIVDRLEKLGLDPSTWRERMQGD